MVVRGSGGLAWSSKQRGNSGTLDYISRPAVIVSYHERCCIAGEELRRGEGRKRGGRRRDFHFLGCCLVRFGALVSSSFFFFFRARRAAAHNAKNRAAQRFLVRSWRRWASRTVTLQHKERGVEDSGRA